LLPVSAFHLLISDFKSHLTAAAAALTETGRMDLELIGKIPMVFFNRISTFAAEFC
jgi:hypothetical protein